jgi:hypothetical protein
VIRERGDDVCDQVAVVEWAVDAFEPPSACGEDASEGAQWRLRVLLAVVPERIGPHRTNYTDRLTGNVAIQIRLPRRSV